MAQPFGHGLTRRKFLTLTATAVAAVTAACGGASVSSPPPSSAPASSSPAGIGAPATVGSAAPTSKPAASPAASGKPAASGAATTVVVGTGFSVTGMSRVGRQDTETGHMVNLGLITRDTEKYQNLPGLAEQIPTIDNGLWKVNDDGTMLTTWK